ncbi:MAG: ABC transporter permease [Theionarchaea archaeon]|nr:ABC transporter permease [Theionarchaea archaeon]
MTSALNVLYLNTVRELKTYVRYKAGLMSILMPVLILIIMIILIPILDTDVFFSTSGTKNIFSFVAAGLAFSSFYELAVNASTRLYSDMVYGTVEYIFSQPISRYWYLVSYCISNVVAGVLPFCVLLSLSAFQSEISAAQNVLPLIVTSVLLVGIIIQFSVIFSCLVLIFKVGVGWLFGASTIIQVIAGAYIPVKVFPMWLQYIAYGLPFTYAYDLIHYSLLNTKTIFPVYTEWVVLFVWCIVLSVVALVSLRKTEDYVKKQGLHYI